MPITVLIVDDSHFFQRVLTEIISENKKFVVVGVANNGLEAIEKVNSLRPDVVTMDYEMPMMDGVTAVREIMSTNPLPILMLSSMTFSGAKITIDALEAGAADFMTKNFAEISGKGTAIKKRLYDTLLALGQSRSPHEASTTSASESTQRLLPVQTEVCEPVKATTSTTHFVCKTKKNSNLGKLVKMVAIGASTGGPAALTDLLKGIPADFRFPILIIQHMPQNFTLAFSQRLNKQCEIEVKEAEDGDYIQPGRALLAPGGKQMIIDKNNKNRVKVTESVIDIHYKPCVDINFASLSNSYGGSVLGIVLTGMGSDGCDGARLLTEKGSTIWTQTQESCVVYGMPMAVDRANLSSASFNIKDMTQNLKEL
jgi:two-component system chemotaxis response regulator CheB